MDSVCCKTCGESHDGVPLSYRLDFPVQAYPRDAVRFERDGELVLAGDDRFILGNIELPIVSMRGSTFVWTCWISLSKASYKRIQATWNAVRRENEPPAFGYLSNTLPTYEPSTLGLKTNVHLRALGLRPLVELEPTDHPLAVEQREGIHQERIMRLYRLSAGQ